MPLAAHAGSGFYLGAHIGGGDQKNEIIDESENTGVLSLNGDPEGAPVRTGFPAEIRLVTIAVQGPFGTAEPGQVFGQVSGTLFRG